MSMANSSNTKMFVFIGGDDYGRRHVEIHPISCSVGRDYFCAGRGVLACAAFHLFAGNRPDVRDIPADTGERFHDRNDENNKKRHPN